MFRVYWSVDDWADFEKPEDVTRRWGVMGIVQPCPHDPHGSRYKGRDTPACRFEYYLWADSIGYWQGLKTESDMLDWLLNVGVGDVRNILKGRYMSWRDFDAVYERMKADDVAGLPEKHVHDRHNEFGVR